MLFRSKFHVIPLALLFSVAFIVVRYFDAQAASVLSSNKAAYAVSDIFTIQLANATPNSVVEFLWWKNGVAYDGGCGAGNWCPVGGNTDMNGNWTVSGTYDQTLIGAWKEQARTGTLISNQINFTISNTVSPTPYPTQNATPYPTSCTNPSPLPAGFAAPCPYFSVSPAVASNSLDITSIPPQGTTYVYRTIYVSENTNPCTGKAGAWCPMLLPAPYAYTDWKVVPSTLTLTSQLANLSAGTHYVLQWDWVWDAAANGGVGCYKGPGLNQCNTGTWRIQSFSLTSGTTLPPAGSGPMLLLDLTIAGEGSQSTMTIAASPLIGFYTAPVLDDGEYVAKLLDASGQTLFMHGFNSPNIMATEAEIGNMLDLANSGGTGLSSLNTGIVLPAVSGATQLVITGGAGATISQRSVAAAVEEAHRQYAMFKPHFTPDIVDSAHAAGGVLKIAVLGTLYPDKASFDRDWQEFERRMRSIDPYTTLGSNLVITPIYDNSANAMFTPGELGCHLGYKERCGGYICAPSAILNNTVKLSSFDNVVVFTYGQLGGGCANVDSNRGNSRFATVNSRSSDQAGRVAVHELSHAFGGLIDEYLVASPDPHFISLANNPNFNCDASASCNKWTGLAGTVCRPGCLTSSHHRSLDASLMNSPGMYEPYVQTYGPYNKKLIQQQLVKFGIGSSPTADNDVPVVGVLTPKNNDQLTGTKVMWALATDNVAVSRVEFYRNGSLIGQGIQGVDPKTFRLSWNSSSAPDGLHEIYAKAYDAAGKTGESQHIKVVINNSQKPLLSSNTNAYKYNETFTLNITGSAALAGKTVKFRWKKDGAAYVPAGAVDCISYNGSTWCHPGGQNQPVITTNGTWTASGTYNDTLVGDWVEQALIGTNLTTNEIAFSIANPAGAPSGNGPCGTLNGLEVVCMQRGGTYSAAGSITYGSGFTAGSPAMGMGGVMGPGGAKIGYIPLSYPFTCTATGGTRSAGTSNVADGKICEVIFSSTNPGTGTASYDVHADANAPAGDFLFGLGASSGATIAEPDFYIRIQ